MRIVTRKNKTFIIIIIIIIIIVQTRVWELRSNAPDP